MATTSVLPPSRRWIELLLIITAAGITAAAEAVVDLTDSNRLTAHVAGYGCLALGLGLVGHVAIRRVAAYADPLMLPCVVLLVGLGVVMIHRLDVGLAQQASEEGTTYRGVAAPSQVLWAVLGCAVFIAVLVGIRDHQLLARYAYTLALAGLFLLLLPAVLPARLSEVNGARIVIKLPGLAVQPGEIARLALTVFAASYLVGKREVLALAGRRVLGLTLPRGRDLGPVLVAWLLSIGLLVRNHDLGTSLMFLGLFVVLLYVATERVSWVLIGVLLFTAGCYVSYHLFASVHERVMVWLHVFRYTNDQGYQMAQSLFGLGTGGLFGAGLGGGRPQLVPVAKADFILSAFGEELGLFGLVAILAVYVVLISRGLAAGLQVRDSFGKLLATGISFSIAWQLFVVAGGISRLLPETGLSTPFLSYGGSSLLASFAMLAVLVRIPDAARRPPVAGPAAPAPATAGIGSGELS